MGGRGAWSASAAVIKTTTVSEEERLNKINAQMEIFGSTMEETASHATGYGSGAPWATKEGYDKYWKAANEYRKLRNERDTILTRRLERQELERQKHPIEQPRKKTFVNSFGEATTRYITNTTYERALKRTEKEIQSRMRGFR